MSTTASLPCLEALVGLRDVCDQIDGAGAYLDQLGISARELRDYLTADHADVASLFLSCRATACLTVAASLQKYLRPRYRTRSLLENGRVGYHAPNLAYDPVLPGRVGGWHLSLDFPDSYLELLIPSLTVQLDTTGPVAVNLYDLQQGTLLETVTVDAVAGELVTVHPHWRVAAPRRPLSLLVARDLSTVAGVRTITSARVNCGTCAASAARPWAYLTGRPAYTAGTFLDSALTYTSTAAGLSVVTSVVCDHEGWLCGLSRSLTLPLLYATAREVYDRALRSTYAERLNSRTADPERLRELRAEYATLAEGALQQVAGGVAPPQDENCFYCERTLRTVTALP